MKKTKISALFVTAAMLIQSMPMIMAAEEATIPNELDFENVAAGTQLSSMQGVVVNYGSPTVEKDEKGSMAIKINSPSELRFKLVGDKRYTSIEYKYRVESHTANNNLYEFGSILNGENRMLKSAIYGSRLISYFAQENATVSNMLQNDRYITMKYVVDTQAKTTEIYVNGFKKSNYKGTTFGYFNDTDGAPDTLLFNPRIDGIEYYIDDIKWEMSDELITESEPVSSVRTFSNDSDLEGVTFTNTSNKEIVTEDDGNKALKITGANGVKFAVQNETTSEKVEVSFDMKAESLTNFNGYLDPCFDVRNGNTGAVHTLRRQRGMLAYYGTNNMWVSNHINSAAAGTLFADTASGKYTKIKYVIDTKKQSYKLYVDGTAKEHSGNYDWGYYNTGIYAIDNLYLNFPSGDVVYIDNVTIKDSFLELESTIPSDGQENVSYLNRNIEMNFTSEIGEDFVNADYIKIYEGERALASSEYSLSRQSDTKIMLTFTNRPAPNTEYKIVVSKEVNNGTEYMKSEKDLSFTYTTGEAKEKDASVFYDFEDCNSGEAPQHWTVSAPSNSSVSVEEDGDNGKALKMIVGNSGNPTKALLNFDETVGNKLYVSYDVKAENHTRSFLNDGFGSIGYDGNSAVKGATYGNSALYYFGQNNTSVYQINDNKYHHIELEMDMVNKKYSIWVDGVRRSNYKSALFEFDSQLYSVNSLWFGARYTGGDSICGGKKNDYGIYWIDNVAVKPSDLRIVTSFPINNTENAPIERDISVTFNETADKSLFTNENVKLYANNVLKEYTLKFVSEKEIEIKPADTMTNNTEYKVVFSKNMGAENDIVLSFKTAQAVGDDDPFEPELTDIENGILPEFTPYFNFTVPNVKSGAEIEAESKTNSNSVYTGKTWINSDNVAFEFMKIKSEPFYSLDDKQWHDDTYAAAYIAYPASAAASGEKLPAILLLHGSGQTAQSDTFYNNANKWAKAGYIVMAVDLPGIAVPPSENTVSAGTVFSIKSGDRDKYRFITNPSVKANTTYISETTALRAFNLLRSSKLTDKNNIGITGISMGGYSTTLLSGLLGDKVKAAFSAYGCGFYEYGTVFGTYLNPESTISPNYGKTEEIYNWLKYFDAGRRAVNIKANMFFGAAANDVFYYPSGVMKTYDTAENAASRNIYFAPNQSHASSQIGGTEDSTKRSIWKSEDSFFDYYLKGEGDKPVSVEFASNIYGDSQGENAVIDVNVNHGVKAELSEPVLYYSIDNGTAWQNRKWQQLDGAVALEHETGEVGYYTANIPSELMNDDVDFYISVSDKTNNISASTKIYEGVKLETRNIYVDAAKGDDNGNGTENEPYKTISRARQRIREDNKNISGDVYVIISGGEYCETLSLTSSDKLQNGGKIHYTAKNGEVPVISGGKHISGWELYDKDKNIYRVTNSDLSDTEYMRQLYVDGRQAVRARSDDGMGIKGYDSEKCVTDNTAIANWNNLQDVEVIFAIAWTNPRLNISSVNAENGKTYLTLNQTGYNAVNNDNASTAIFNENTAQEAWYVENAYELLDECGEWYFDRQTKYLYYKPMPYEDMTKTDVVMPVEETLLRVSGKANDSAGNVEFNGLKFMYTSWLKPSRDGFYIGAQNNIDNSLKLDVHGVIYSGAVELKYADNVTLSNSVISAAGSNGIVMCEGVKNTAVKECNMFDIAGGAIYTGPFRATSDNLNPSEANKLINILVADNIIHNIGTDYKSASAVSAGYPVNTSFIHNEIYNTPFDGFHIGYGWNKPLQNQIGGKGIRIENNYIHDVMNSRLYDGGAIYTLGGTGASSDNPNIISGNYIKNQYNNYGALYNDEGSNNWYLTDNVFDNSEAEKPIRFLHWHTSSIEGCKAVHNYSTTDSVYNNTGGKSSCSELILFSHGNEPSEVNEIIKNAGVRKETESAVSLSCISYNNTFKVNAQGISDLDNTTAAIYAAVYENGILKRVTRKNIRMNRGIRINENAELDGLEKGSYTGKAFLWETGNMKAVSGSEDCTFEVD